MKIQSRDIPPALIAVWKDALGHLPDATLRGLAQTRGLSAGFRPGKMDPAIARTRLRTWLDSAGELPDELRLALRPARPASALSRFLSESFIAEQMSPLTRAFGEAETLAALLIDGREALRDQALDRLAAWDDGKPPQPDETERQAASAELAQQLAPLAAALQALRGPDETGDSTTPSASDQPCATTARTPRPQSERELVTGLRDARRQTRQLQRDLDASRIDAARLKAELERITPQWTQTRTRADALAADLAGLQAQFDERVAERVQARLNARLLPWLAPAEQLAAAAAAEGQGATLLERADALLEKQAELDRRYGLRRQLQAELDACRDRLARVIEARRQSLRPMADQLAELECALEARSAELLGLLDAPAGDEALPERLDAALNSVTGLEALAALRQALQATEPLALLSEAQRSRAYERIDGTASRLYASAGMSRTPALEREGLKNLPLYALQTLLAQGRAATLVVDGHNALFMLPALFRPHFENGTPGARAREALEERLLGLARSQPRLSIQLWFDGATRTERSLADNFKVNFSGGSGDNRADDQIIAFLHHLEQASPELARAVVTADRDEARAAERTGAMVMAPEELARWLA